MGWKGKNNYFIGPNFENAVGFFVGGEESLLLSNFGSELSEKRVKNLVKQYDFRVKPENHVSRDFSLVFHEILTQNMDSKCDFSTPTYKPSKF